MLDSDEDPRYNRKWFIFATKVLPKKHKMACYINRLPYAALNFKVLEEV